MTKESTRINSLAGDGVSENGVRGVFGRRRRTAPATTTDAVHELPAQSRAPRENTSPSPAGPRTLRRWSVGELIARAIAAPPTDSLGHS